MSRFWSIDSPLMNGLGTIADIFLLNIMYVICCIPVVTIGAATSALYTVTMQITRNEYPAVTKAFFFAGFALLAYVKSKLFAKVFERHE